MCYYTQIRALLPKIILKMSEQVNAILCIKDGVCLFAPLYSWDAQIFYTRLRARVTSPNPERSERLRGSTDVIESI